MGYHLVLYIQHPLTYVSLPQVLPVMHMVVCETESVSPVPHLQEQMHQNEITVPGQQYTCLLQLCPPQTAVVT